MNSLTSNRPRPPVKISCPSLMTGPRESTFNKDEFFLLCTLAAIQFTHIVDFMLMMPLGPQLMRLFDL
ncbi:MAG: hypothetical protein K2X47_10215, partial [Bdellovibrionales bacterium]|nr:hypothetical protein [Bdellovibrionales bacterium]